MFLYLHHDEYAYDASSPSICLDKQNTKCADICYYTRPKNVQDLEDFSENQ